jgi:hypothetical protein
MLTPIWSPEESALPRLPVPIWFPPPTAACWLLGSAIRVQVHFNFFRRHSSLPTPADLTPCTTPTCLRCDQKQLPASWVFYSARRYIEAGPKSRWASVCLALYGRGLRDIELIRRRSGNKLRGLIVEVSPRKSKSWGGVSVELCANEAGRLEASDFDLERALKQAWAKWLREPAAAEPVLLPFGSESPAAAAGGAS